MNQPIEQRHRDFVSAVLHTRFDNALGIDEVTNELERIAANAFPSNAWIAVTKYSLPKEDVDFLCLYRHGRICSERAWVIKHNFENHFGLITHWQPLPLPPELKEGAGA